MAMTQTENAPGGFFARIQQGLTERRELRRECERLVGAVKALGLAPAPVDLEAKMLDRGYYRKRIAALKAQLAGQPRPAAAVSRPRPAAPPLAPLVRSAPVAAPRSADRFAGGAANPWGLPGLSADDVALLLDAERWDKSLRMAAPPAPGGSAVQKLERFEGMEPGPERLAYFRANQRDLLLADEARRNGPATKAR